MTQAPYPPEKLFLLPIADLLRNLHVSSGLFLEADFTAPWCVVSRVAAEDCARFVPVPAGIVAFHYVCNGRLWLAAGSDAPVQVGQGELVLLPRNDEHRLGSDTALPPVGADALIRPADDGGLASIEHGGGGEPVRLVCGYLGTEREHHPLLALLPRVMKVAVDDSAAAAWIDSSFRYAARQSGAGAAGELGRLAELLFVHAVRRHFAAVPGSAEALAAASGDPRIAAALALLHGDLARRWTTARLAREVALSRSAFHERFTQALGETPMRYLARQRLAAAAGRLRESADPIARIAFDTGYESEAAFSRAFRRQYRVPPAAWRRAAGT